jgi:uncharacterized membrane protein YbaN (DUF454 family)
VEGVAVLRIAKVAGGFGLLIIGIAGLLLPIMPGWIFVIPGLGLLAAEFEWARRLLDRVKKSHPKHWRKGTSEPPFDSAQGREHVERRP